MGLRLTKRCIGPFFRGLCGLIALFIFYGFFDVFTNTEKFNNGVLNAVMLVVSIPVILTLILMCFTGKYPYWDSNSN